MDKNDEFEDNTENYEDDFGLPDVNYKPLKDDSEGYENDDDQKYRFSDDDDDEGKNPLSIAIVIGVIVVLLGGGALVYNFIIKPNAEKEKQEELAIKKRNAERKEKANLARLQREQEEATQKAIEDSLAQAETSTGQGSGGARGPIEILGGPTGLYHVIISSGLDDDLLMDYAKVLSRRGVKTQVIPPYGKTKFHRLSVGEGYETWAKAEAQAREVGAKYTYKGNAWVLKY